MTGRQTLGFVLMLTLATLLALPMGADIGEAGQIGSTYKVLAPISRGNLTIFPVVTDRTHDTQHFLTLDEGVRSGEVVVSEAGSVRPLIRGHERYIPSDGAEVNRLVLVNNSERPLILLAGEIVTGGKQDRVVGKDRIVPAKSDPIDLAVFCVEPGRWVATKSEFGSFHSQMAQPSVRRSAMADQNQQKVWSEVNSASQSLGMAASPAAARAMAGTSSYAGVMANDEVKRRVDAVAAPIEQSYLGLMRELRERNAVGVVVAVNGRIIWADMFASTGLLEKYWPKLIRSYAAEALTQGKNTGQPDLKDAQAFLEDFGARHEAQETEPGVYRRTELTGSDFTAFALTALLPGTGFDIHIAKMED
ncbi:MAG: ARPP-1 family domain-containing protein [Terriglobia bacterium]